MTLRRTLSAGVVIAVFQAAPAIAQTLGQGSDKDIPWVRLTAAMLLCIGLAVGAAFALNRRLKGGGSWPIDWSRVLQQLGKSAGQASPPARLTDIETRRLSTQVTVSVFRCDGRSFMVASSLQGQLELVRLDDEEAGDDT